jgi:hypothetical protein
MYSNEIGSWVNEIYIGVKRPDYKPRKKVKKIKPKKIRVPAKRGIELDYCIYCDCHFQHRIAAQHKRCRKHLKNIASNNI